jgi:hypothetical protein
VPTPDLTFREALRRRLSRLTPAERVLILSEALRLLRTVLPRLEPAAQRTLALQVAAALEAAGCTGEATALRLCVGADPPPRVHQQRHCGRRWADRCRTYVLD